MKKKFIQMIIQEKGPNDFRSFVHAHFWGKNQEIRGYGETVEKAADDGWKKFQEVDE